MNHDPTEAVATRTGEEQNLTWLLVVREAGWVEQGSRYELTNVAGTRGAKILSGQLWPCPRAEQGQHGEDDLIPCPVGLGQCWSQRECRLCSVSLRIL